MMSAIINTFFQEEAVRVQNTRAASSPTARPPQRLGRAPILQTVSALLAVLRRGRREELEPPVDPLVAHLRRPVRARRKDDSGRTGGRISAVEVNAAIGRRQQVGDLCETGVLLPRLRI